MDQSLKMHVARHFQKDIARSVEGFISTGKKQMEIGERGSLQEFTYLQTTFANQKNFVAKNDICRPKVNFVAKN